MVNIFTVVFLVFLLVAIVHSQLPHEELPNITRSCGPMEGNVCSPTVCSISRNLCVVNKNAYCLSDRCGCEARFFVRNETTKAVRDISNICNSFNIARQMIRFHPEHDEMLSNQTQQNLTFFGHVQYFPGFDFAVIQLNLAGGIPEVLKSLVNIPQRDGISKDIRDEIRKKLHAYNEIAANATETLDAMDSAGKTEHADDSGSSLMDENISLESPESGRKRSSKDKNKGKGKLGQSTEKSPSEKNALVKAHENASKNPDVKTTEATPNLFGNSVKAMLKYYKVLSDMVNKVAALNMEILNEFSKEDGVFRLALKQSDESDLPIDKESFTLLAKSFSQRIYSSKPITHDASNTSVTLTLE